MPNVIDFDRKVLNRASPQGFKVDKKARFSCENKGGEATIRIYDSIGPDWAGMIGAETVARALDEIGDVETLNVRVNSPGGDVFEGAAIYNLLVQNAAKVLVTIDSLAASMASVIAMAGDEIAIAKNGQMMIHQVRSFFFGTSQEFRAWADVMDQIENAGNNIYSERSGQTFDQVKTWSDAETWMTAEQAVERGFADRIIENKSGEKAAKNEAAERLESFAAKNRLRLLELEGVEV